MSRITPLLIVALGLLGCPEDKPETTRSFFDEAKTPSAGAMAGTGGALPAGHPSATGVSPGPVKPGVTGLPSGHPPLGAPGAGMAGAAAPANPGAEVLSGTISIGEAHQAAVPKGVLYIVARGQGSGESRGPPILVKRAPATGFPAPFALTEGDRMVAGTPIPETLVLQVRIDQDGDAISRTPGDLEGVLEAKKGANDVAVVLDQRTETAKPGMNVGQ